MEVIMKNLRIGIVGGGGMGRVHFANWQVVENASVVALCDTAPSAADTAAQWGVPLYRSITVSYTHLTLPTT